MTNKLVRPVSKTYIPGVPAVPPQPRRCYTRTRSVPQLGSVSPPDSTYVGLPEVNTGVQYSGFLVPIMRQVEPYIDSAGNLVTEEIAGYRNLRFAPNPNSQPSYTTVYETVCDPAVPGKPGIPAQVIKQNEGPDWRASSRSIESVAGDVVATFITNPDPRSMVGFSARDTGANQSDIRMGVVFAAAGAATQLRPIVNGVAQNSVANFAGERIALARINGRFYIQLDGAVVYNVEATTDEPLHLDAMLYTSADYVDDPTLTAGVSSSVGGALGFKAGLSGTTGVSGGLGFAVEAGTLVGGQALAQVRGSVGFSGAVLSKDTQWVPVDGAVGFSGSLREGVLSLTGTPVGVDSGLSGATVTVGPVQVLGSDSDYADGRPTLPRIQVEGAGGQVSQAVAGGDLVLAPPLTYGTMLSGGLIDSELSLRPISVFSADRAYGAGAVSLPKLDVFADDGFGIPNYYGHNEPLELMPSFSTDPSLFASIYETLELEAEMSFAVLVSGSVLEGLLLTPTLSVNSFLQALIESGINLSSATQMPDPAVAQYAFNALTGAATRYSGFGFTQFTRVGGETYAIKPDGLYRLRPGDDNGERRSALVDFGTMSFGVSQRKNIETMYLGMTTDGTVYAKLKADGGNEKVYRVIQREPTMRVRTGKGVTAREWDLKLEVVDATRVDLDNIDFVVGASARRWTR